MIAIGVEGGGGEIKNWRGENLGARSAINITIQNFPDLIGLSTFGVPRYIENIENILRKSICQSVLRTNLASKKKTLARFQKHKKKIIICQGISGRRPSFLAIHAKLAKKIHPLFGDSNPGPIFAKNSNLGPIFAVAIVTVNQPAPPPSM